MKKILFLTNIPAPYRVKFFDEMARYADVTVIYSERNEDNSERDAAWFIEGANRYHAVYLKKRINLPGGRFFCPDVTDWLKKPWDSIVICGYDTLTYIYSHAWLRARKRPYYIEIDGGIVAPESRAKFALKSWLIRGACGWFSTGTETDRYYLHYGAKREGLHFSPFSSLTEAELPAEPLSPAQKTAAREQLGISETHVILAVGQFIPRKGFDVMLRGAAALRPDTGIYFVGGEPTPEYRNLAKDCGNTNIHFVGFRRKEVLDLYYQAADVFVLPTREDIWGLVINEAMGFGLPIVTTDRCVAGLELVRSGVNGYLVPVEDSAALAEKLNVILDGDPVQMGRAALETIRPYTVEGMARAHRDVLC